MTAGEKQSITKLEDSVKEAKRKYENFKSPYLATALRIATQALKHKQKEIAAKYHGIQQQLL